MTKLTKSGLDKTGQVNCEHGILRKDVLSIPSLQDFETKVSKNGKTIISKRIPSLKEEE